MKKLLPFALIVFTFAACDTNRGQNEDTDTTAVSENNNTRSDTSQLETVEAGMLEKAWSTDTILTTSESVIYDKQNKQLLVSNINGDPRSEDGNGFITALTLDGKVSEVYWFSGSLNAPKGMGIHDGKLYVTDINRILEIEIADQFISNTYTIDTARFLNDIAVGPDGKVYFSDMETNTIYTLNNGNISTFLNSKDLNGPNGLYIDGKTMMVATMNGSQVLKVNMEDKSIKEFSKGIGAGDGLAAVGDGSFLASSWSGKVFLIDAKGSKKTLLDTEKDKINSADIEYVPEENLLLVPTFRGNSVVAYKLNKNRGSNTGN